jgi:hypothetical protein
MAHVDDADTLLLAAQEDGRDMSAAQRKQETDVVSRQHFGDQRAAVLLGRRCLLFRHPTLLVVLARNFWKPGPILAQRRK